MSGTIVTWDTEHVVVPAKVRLDTRTSSKRMETESLSRRDAEGQPVSETRELLFTDAEINQQALANASALPYLMVAFARACGRTAGEVAAFSGRIFAPGWARLSGAGAYDVLRIVALNLVCCGGEVEKLSGDADSAEARITGVPAQVEADFFGITTAEADDYSSIFAPIVETLGFTFSWRRDGPELVYTLRRTAFE